MKVNFDIIKPYVRFVRNLSLTHMSKLEPSYPYDARLFYTTDGNGTILADGVEYSMQKGALISINSGVKYHLKTPKDYVTYIAVNFDFTFANSNKKIPIHPANSSEYNRHQLIENITFSDASFFNKVLYIEQLPIIKKHLISMEKEYSTRFCLYELRLSSLMTNILVKCFRQATIHASSTDEKELADKIVVYIARNFHKKLSNEDIAKKFNYHPNYISSLIRNYTGLPLHQYIKHIRINNAKDLLMLSNKSISEVATDCGFYDAGHFIRCFKDIIGITPQQYRNYYL